MLIFLRFYWQRIDFSPAKLTRICLEAIHQQELGEIHEEKEALGKFGCSLIVVLFVTGSP